MGLEVGTDIFNPLSFRAQRGISVLPPSSDLRVLWLKFSQKFSTRSDRIPQHSGQPLNLCFLALLFGIREQRPLKHSRLFHGSLLHLCKNS